MAQRGAVAPALRMLSGAAVLAPAGAAPALASGPAPAAFAPTSGPMAAPWAALVSAGLHAGAALALVAVPVLIGAGSAGNGGLDSATRPQPPSVQVTMVTPADLLPDTAPQLAATAPEAPASAPAEEAPPPPTLTGAPEPPAQPAPLLAAPALDAPPAAPDGTLPPPPAAKADTPPKPAKPARKPARPEAPASAKASGTGGGAVAGAAGQAKDAGLSKSRIADLKSAWGAKIRARVDARKTSPRGADASGTVKVRLTVARTGKLLAVSIAASSGVEALDRAALKAVKAAGRFPAAPKGLTDDSYSFTLPVRFAR